MSKTIKISKESVERFNHDKNVVGAKNEARRVPCPINNQADMHSDELFDALFDNSEWVDHKYVTVRPEHDTHEYGSWHKTVGFILELPMTVSWLEGSDVLMIYLSYYSIDDIDTGLVTNELSRRLTCENVEGFVSFLNPSWLCHLLYNEQWCKENLG